MSDWKTCTLEDACEIFDGPHATPEKQDSGPYFLSISSLQNGHLDLSESAFISEEDYSEWTRRVIPRHEDIVFSYETRLGQAAMVPKGLRCCLGRRMGLLRSKDRSFADPHFLLHYYLGDPFQKVIKDNTVFGTTVDRIPLQKMGGFEIALPPLPEQKKIAEILSGIDLFKDKLSKKSCKLEKLLASLSFGLLSGETRWADPNDAETRLVPSDWLVVNVGSVAQSIVPGRNKPKKFDGDIPWITISDLSDFIVCRSKKGLSVSRNSLSDAGGKTVPKNSVVLSVVGSFGLSSVTGAEVALNQQLHAFVCGNQIIPEFLSLCIRNSEEKLERLATQTTISYINKQNVESLLIPLPSLEEQKKIVNIISSLRNECFRLNRQIIQLNHLKSSLSSDLLSGRRRVSV